MCCGPWLHQSDFLHRREKLGHRSSLWQSGPPTVADAPGLHDCVGSLRRMFLARTDIFMETIPDVTLLGTVMP